MTKKKLIKFGLGGALALSLVLAYWLPSSVEASWMYGCFNCIDANIGGPLA